jgi:hypothetical protein
LLLQKAPIGILNDWNAAVSQTGLRKLACTKLFVPRAVLIHIVLQELDRTSNQSRKQHDCE